jgi:hypothetical protein
MGFVGTDYFTYRATDGTVQSNLAIVELVIYESLSLSEAAIPSKDVLDVNLLQRMISAAGRRWQAAGVDRAIIYDALSTIRFDVVDLPGAHLGGSTPDGRILIDVNAAGHGWFVDATPNSDREFARRVSRSERQATRGSEAYGHVDLLTVISHEIAHVLGLKHSDEATNIMADTLGLGTRRNPTAFDAAIVEWLYSAQRERRK